MTGPADHGPGEPSARDLAAVADRLDALAESAELMGDDAGAGRYRTQAADCRLRAMALLDRADHGGDHSDDEPGET